MRMALFCIALGLSASVLVADERRALGNRVKALEASQREYDPSTLPDRSWKDDMDAIDQLFNRISRGQEPPHLIRQTLSAYGNRVHNLRNFVQSLNFGEPAEAAPGLEPAVAEPAADELELVPGLVKVRAWQELKALFTDGVYTVYVRRVDADAINAFGEEIFYAVRIEAKDGLVPCAGSYDGYRARGRVRYGVWRISAVRDAAGRWQVTEYDNVNPGFAEAGKKSSVCWSLRDIACDEVRPFSDKEIIAACDEFSKRAIKQREALRATIQRDPTHERTVERLRIGNENLELQTLRLEIAVQNGFDCEVRRLVGALPTLQLAIAYNPAFLIWALRNGHFTIARYLVKVCGAPLDKPFDLLKHELVGHSPFGPDSIEGGTTARGLARQLVEDGKLAEGDFELLTKP